MSPEEIDANQLQINSAVEAISRIANTTTFAGRPLLDGSLDYVTSGVAASAITSLQINRASFGTHAFIPVQVDVTQSAQQAALYFLASNTGTSAITIEVKGSNGVATVVLGSASPASAIVRAINNQSDVTGAVAEYINSAAPASGVVIHSFDYGSDVMVSVKAISGGPFVLKDQIVGGVTRDADFGQDAEATINGHLSTGRGLQLVMNTSELEMTLRLADTFGVGSTSFAITGGGALFQLGPAVNTNQQVNIGVQSVAASRLGNPIVGYLNQIVEGGEYSLRKPNGPHQAGLIISQAIKQVSGLRGRLGSFERNTLDTNVNALNITMENLTSAESVIRDADFAQETANLSRAQILQQAGTAMVAQANQLPQGVLALLR